LRKGPTWKKAGDANQRQSSALAQAGFPAGLNPMDHLLSSLAKLIFKRLNEPMIIRRKSRRRNMGNCIKSEYG
jgi:hypothetical protein